jgi:hypothetical protein
MLPISIQQLARGLYWITQRSLTKGVEHHAILDVGNCIGFPDVYPTSPIIVHQTPPSIRRDPFTGTLDWRVVMKIEDEPNSICRLIAACENPLYNTAANNCEHFARYVATGKRESHQVRAVGFVGVLIGLAWASAA